MQNTTLYQAPKSEQLLPIPLNSPQLEEKEKKYSYIKNVISLKFDTADCPH